MYSGTFFSTIGTFFAAHRILETPGRAVPRDRQRRGTRLQQTHECTSRSAAATGNRTRGLEFRNVFSCESRYRSGITSSPLAPLVRIIQHSYCVVPCSGVDRHFSRQMQNVERPVKNLSYTCITSLLFDYASKGKAPLNYSSSGRKQVDKLKLI